MNSHRVNSKRPFLAYFASIRHSTIIIPHCTPKIQSQRHNFVNNDNDNDNGDDKDIIMIMTVIIIVKVIMTVY